MEEAPLLQRSCRLEKHSFSSAQVQSTAVTAQMLESLWPPWDCLCVSQVQQGQLSVQLLIHQKPR